MTGRKLFTTRVCLGHQGIGPDGNVGICVPRGEYTCLAVLAVLKVYVHAVQRFLALIVEIVHLFARSRLRL